jgi:hypothetical protein
MTTENKARFDPTILPVEQQLDFLRSDLAEVKKEIAELRQGQEQLRQQYESHYHTTYYWAPNGTLEVQFGTGYYRVLHIGRYRDENGTMTPPPSHANFPTSGPLESLQS